MTRLEELFEKYYDNLATEPEREEFFDLLQNADRDIVLTMISDSRLLAKLSGLPLETEKQNHIIDSILRHEANDALHRQMHWIHFLKTAWFRYAAAVLLIIIGVAVYYNWFHTSSDKNKIVQTTSTAKDILPGRNRAILTLSDGRQVQLNNATSETIQDENLSIENHNGQLNYYPGSQSIPSKGGVAPGAANPRENHSYPGAGVGYNTMTTPRGGQYKLTLADGTKVWLNAASSITYPTAFKGKTREVTINGEAYFEVAKNKEKPFIVSTVNDRITVLGTSFNVNAYEDEPDSKTSLAEGSIKIKEFTLKPGQAFTKGKIISTNIDQDLAWKNGVFNFNNVKIRDAARQIARWYDVEIQFDGPIPDVELYGGVNRSSTLQGLIKGMEGEFAHFTLKGKVLHIKAL